MLTEIWKTWLGDVRDVIVKKEDRHKSYHLTHGSSQRCLGRVHADFAELSRRQYLLMIDTVSKWPEVHELGTHATTEQTMNAMRLTFSYHRLPRRLVRDNGPQFRSHEFQMFMKTNGIRHQFTPP